MRRALLAVMVLGSGLGAQAPMTPDQAVAMARTRGPLAAAAAGRRLVTAGRGRTDAAWPNPTAEWRRENYDSPLQPDIFATLQVPVDLTGRRLALRQAGSLAGQRGVADSASAIRQLDVDVLRAFWRASLANELETIAEGEREARERTATFDAQRFREGAVAEVSAMRTQLEADRARIASAAAQADAARARADLARLLGTTMDSLGPLQAVSTGALEGIAVPDTSWTTVRAQRPDLAAARLAAAEGERRWRAEQRGLLGDLNVVGGYKGTGGYATGLLGVLVPLPLFNRNEGPRERTRGEYVIAHADLQDLELRARGEVRAAAQAWDVVVAAGRAGAATLSERATEVARIAEASYREGAISLVELIEAQRARSDARAAAARWAHDAHLARLELHRATGASLTRTP